MSATAIPLLVLTGPTGSGKSGIAPLVAEKRGAEIICADSRQIFREIAIGSAAPLPSETRGVPHHLYGVLDPSEECSAGRFRGMAEPVIDGVRLRGKIPMLVGGSGLYIESLAGQIGLAPPVRRETVSLLRKQAETGGARSLWEELSGIDPASAEKINPSDSFRIVRAISVYRETGKTFSSFLNPTPSRYSPILRAAIAWPRNKLYERIDARCDEMIKAGILEEARLLKERGLSPSLPAMRSIGYHHLFAVLDGNMTLKQAVELMKRDSRRYAKRQFTWLRGRGGNVAWFEGEDGPATLVERLSKHYESVIF